MLLYYRIKENKLKLKISSNNLQWFCPFHFLPNGIRIDTGGVACDWKTRLLPPSRWSDQRATVAEEVEWVVQ